MTESTTKTGSRPSRTGRSRTTLLETTRALLIENGPRSVTVDAVSERSGVAKSTLYRHFSSRDDLMLAAVRESIPPPPEIDHNASFEDGLRTFITAIAVELLDGDWGQILPAVMMLRRHNPEMDKVLNQDQAPKAVMLKDLLARGHEIGVVGGPIPEYLAATMLIGPLIFSSVTKDGQDAEQLANYVVDQFLAANRP